MIDDYTWRAMRDQLSTVAALPQDAEAAGKHPPADDFGGAHIILSGDFKQLPPATSRPPFIAEDAEVMRQFDFRVLRENRRLVASGAQDTQQDLEAFHDVLEDVAWNRVSREVRSFFVEAYVRGAEETQRSVRFEGSTACFTKRKYRDGWNRGVLERSALRYQRGLKVKAVFATRGTESQWIREPAAAEIRRTVRSQCLQVLRLAGQWLEDPPVANEQAPHCMRMMLVANIDVPHGFANGASGRILQWHPEGNDGRRQRKSTRANVPGVQVRFIHEEAYKSDRNHFLPNVDFMDIQPRKETVATAKGQPSMLQLPFQPAYALTIHKTQARER